MGLSGCLYGRLSWRRAMRRIDSDCMAARVGGSHRLGRRARLPPRLVLWLVARGNRPISSYPQ